MSFQLQFEKLGQELTEAFNEYNHKVESLPQQLEKLIEGNEKKLSTFIENFQNEILTLKKAQERDCKMIDNLKFENQQRKSQSILLQNATKMEEGLIAKLQSNIASMENTKKEFENRIMKHQQNLNRNVLDVDELQKNKKQNNENLIQVDKENSKLIVRMDRSGGKIYEINYNKRDDKFVINTGDKNLMQAVAEFNFHRDFNKLYTGLFKFS